MPLQVLTRRRKRVLSPKAFIFSSETAVKTLPQPFRVETWVFCVACTLAYILLLCINYLSITIILHCWRETFSIFVLGSSNVPLYHDYFTLLKRNFFDLCVGVINCPLVSRLFYTVEEKLFRPLCWGHQMSPSAFAGSFWLHVRFFQSSGLTSQRELSVRE
jgi:hypothetical protein